MKRPKGVPKRPEKGIHYAGSRQSLLAPPLSTVKTSCGSLEPACVLQGPEEMSTPGQTSRSVPEIQTAEVVAILKPLQVALDRVAKAAQLVGRQRIHRGDIGSSFPSGLMAAD
jgi:hypothetical protein